MLLPKCSKKLVLGCVNDGCTQPRASLPSHLRALRGPRRHPGQPQLRAERRLLARDPLARAARRAVGVGGGGRGGGRGGGGQQREEGHQQLEGPAPRNHITALRSYRGELFLTIGCVNSISQKSRLRLRN